MWGLFRGTIVIYFKVEPRGPWWFSITVSPSPTGGVSVNRWCHASLQLLHQWQCCLCKAHLAAQRLHPQSLNAGITHPRGCKERYPHAHIRLSVKCADSSCCASVSHQVTESVWSCCWRTAHASTWSCRGWGRHCILPARPGLRPVYRCCCTQVT